MIGSVSYWVTLAAMILVLKPLDLLFDLIFKKPAVNPDTNRIYIEGQWLTIGANTLETIYPEENRKLWRDHPEEKIDGTIRLATIQKNMEGYLASLKEKKREAEWRKANG